MSQKGVMFERARVGNDQKSVKQQFFTSQLTLPGRDLSSSPKRVLKSAVDILPPKSKKLWDPLNSGTTVPTMSPGHQGNVQREANFAYVLFVLPKCS